MLRPIIAVYWLVLTITAATDNTVSDAETGISAAIYTFIALYLWKTYGHHDKDWR